MLLFYFREVPTKLKLSFDIFLGSTKLNRSRRFVDHKGIRDDRSTKQKQKWSFDSVLLYYKDWPKEQTSKVLFEAMGRRIRARNDELVNIISSCLYIAID